MIVIPAIDLMGGRPVRLAQGARGSSTTYAHDPRDLIADFVAQGAARVHLVDLDGAFAGEPSQRQSLAALIKHAHACGAGVQVGGGVRTPDHAVALIEAGADFVVIGTLAVRAPDDGEALCHAFPGRIIVAADGKHGKVAIDGWQEATNIDAATLTKQAERWGAAAVLYTEVSRDGMGTGPAIDDTKALQDSVEIPVFASGGVGSLAHIEACARAGLAGVVVGKALYEGAFSLKEALARC